MSKSSPWEEIEKPEQGYNARKVPRTKGVAMNWAKDKAGHCLFLVDLVGDHASLFKKKRVDVRGLKSDLRTADAAEVQRLVITLERHVDQDIFAALCGALITALRKITDSATGLSVALDHLRRWKEFMAVKNRGLLSIDEIRGLFGELLFLRRVLEHSESEEDAVKAWEGPESSPQDFMFGDIAVEVKTVSDRKKNTVRISSEEQLAGAKDRLFLKIFCLAEAGASAGGASLNALVRDIESSFSDPFAVEIFRDKLFKSRYIELDGYDRPEFSVAREYLYQVEDEFPRLIPAKLPAGISNVRYNIDLGSIAAFQVQENILWDK